MKTNNEELHVDKHDELQIEKGIVLIPRKNLPHRKRRFPFDKMEVDDSFFVPDVNKNFSIFKSVQYFNMTREKKDWIVCRQRREGNGVRVWRVA